MPTMRSTTTYTSSLFCLILLFLFSLSTAPAVVAQAPDTLRYVSLADGEVVGEWLTWQESPDTLGYKINRLYYFPRTERLVLDDEGLPVRMDVEGEYGDGLRWYEIYALEDGTARWYTPRERGVTEVSGPAYYAAVHPGHDLGVLARALLRQESATLPLLPEGKARLEALGEQTIEADGANRTVSLYAIHGIDLFPRYVWLAEDESTFAGEWSILAGWEAAFPELRAAMDAALADYRQALARELVPPAQTSPLVIRGARLFDSETGMVHEGTTIVIEDGRITAVGPDNNVEFSNESELIEADGRMAVPGLWDMHAHLSLPGFEVQMEFTPLHLAAGVTTARDLGSHIPSLIALREAVETGRAVGPRILAAGFMDGAESAARWAGVRVGTTEEVREAVDRFAELGFVQIKIYNEMPADLVHVAVERAKEHGLRVSGHVPYVMTASDAVEAGFDEIQHAQMIFAAMLRGSGDEELFAPGEYWESWETSYQVYAELTPESETARDFIALLRDREVAIDPTMGHFISDTAPPGFIADVVDRLPGPVRRRLNHTSFSGYYVPMNPLSRPAWQKTVDNMFGFIVAAHRAGVPILVGTDTWAGFGLHYEMELYVEAGIPASEVLTLTTLGAARVMGMDDELGSIEPGKLADLILIDGNPTKNISDIRRVVTVIKDGRVYDPAAIYRALGIEPCCED
jgi:imidazolonepropionase-like amidohydrolase